MRAFGASLLLGLACVPASRLGGSFDCTPDAGVSIGCSTGLGRECSGRPIMSVCDGMTPHEDCTPDTALPQLLAVDRPPTCPNVSVVCPASGIISVGISQGGSGPYTCTWDHR